MERKKKGGGGVLLLSFLSVCFLWKTSNYGLTSLRRSRHDTAGVLVRGAVASDGSGDPGAAKDEEDKGFKAAVEL